MAAALETELVRVLRALALHELPEPLIKAVFDTGGTTLRRRDDQDAENAVEAATLDRLRDVDRVFTKYLQQFTATQARAGSDDDDGADSAHTRLSSPLWKFLAGDAANIKIMGDEDERAHHFAAYRALFAMLHTLVNISEGYASLDVNDKVDTLTKALVASKVYLTWLQLPGGAAYGLFMPYVYRQVLDVVKKWVDVTSSSETMASLRGNGGSGSQRERTPRQKNTRTDSDAVDSATHKRLVKRGVELLDTMVSFLQNFALSSSKESIVPTIEMAIHVQIAGLNAENASVSTAATRSQRLLEGLMDELHGDVFQTARVIVHCYIPGVCYQEPAVADARTATKFHKFAVEMVGVVQTTFSRLFAAEDDGSELVSTLYLGLAQHLCLNAPDRAEERLRVLTLAFQTTTATELREADRVRFVRFLSSYCKSVKAKNRQFAVELVGKLILEPTTWSISSPVPTDLEQFVGVAALLEILADRSRDKVSAVRAKAIGAISAVLSAGLKHVQNDGEEQESAPFVADPDVISASLREILYTSPSDDDEEVDSYKLEETKLMKRLVELFREGLQDEKTFVRKAAIQALEALIIVRPGSIDPSMRKDLIDVQARCMDSSLLVRVQAAKSLSSMLLKFPDDDGVQRLWNAGVLPLCVDPEATVQTASLELVNRVMFERVARWYDLRSNEEQAESAATVWELASHLDGATIHLSQKALRLLIKDGKAEVKKIVKAAIHAINTCLTQLEENGEAETQYWGFSWILLEELAHSGKLVEAAKKEQHNWGIVVDCWSKLQNEELPIVFAEGSKRILRVIASLAPVIDAQDAKAIADSILASLHTFSIPLNVIAEAVLALHNICKSKAPSEEKGREISFAWGKQLLVACEANLRACFEGDPDLVHDQTVVIQKQLICIGEVALLEFSKDDDKNRESGVTLIPITTIKPLVQLFLPPVIVPNVLSHGPVEEAGMVTPTKGRSNGSSPVTTPIPIRVCAFVTLGKLCLRDQDLAKNCITMFIRELRTCDNKDIRSNILLILGDLCIRYTALVDVYIPTIALSFLDKSPLIRRNAMLLFSQLILQDYIKWRESLLRFFLRAVVDEDEELANLARHVLCGPLLLKSPHLFTNKFIEMIFVFNKFDGKLNLSEPFEREGIDEIALPGSGRFSKRSQLYKFLLQNMSDEQKLQISMKLCTEVLEEVSEGKLKLCANPSEITNFGTEAVLKDTFAILCSPEIKLSSREEQEGDDNDGEDAATEAEGGPSVAAQLAAAKGKLLSKMSKKNFLENVVPVLIGLKHRLESKRSPLMRYLLHYIRELFKLYGQEVRDILSADPQMAMEVEYDLRQYELQRQKQQQQDSLAPSRLSFGGGGASTLTPTKSGNGSANGPRTPLQFLEGGRTPQLLSAGSAGNRRRLSMPTAGTPSHPIPHRHVSSDESKRLAAGDGSTMLFSPDKDAPPTKWRVTAKSPELATRKPSSRFSQKDLEDNMQRDLVAAFDSALSSPGESSPKASRAKENSLPATRLMFDGVEDDEDEMVTLPLKKKTKKKVEKKKKKPVIKAKNTDYDDDDDVAGDSMELKTPKIQRVKRKRN